MSPVLFFLIVAVSNFLVMHRSGANRAIVVVGIATVATTGFQFFAYFRDGHLDAFLVIAVAIQFIGSLVTGGVVAWIFGIVDRRRFENAHR